VAQVEEALDLRAAFLSSTRVIDPAPGDTPRGALRHTFGSLTPQAAAPDLRGFPAGPLPQPQWGGSPYSLRPASLRMSRVKAGGEGS
jgi:hypothetical protein